MTTQTPLMTGQEFFQRYSDKEGRYELVKGNVVKMAPPGGIHGKVALNIGSSLNAYNRQNKLGEMFVETGFYLQRQPDTVRGPDVSFVSSQHLPDEGIPTGFFEGAPDLAVEVVSPSDTAAALEQKVQDYLRHGTQRVWVVYPDSRTVVVFHPDGTARWYNETDIIREEDLLPGFQLPVKDIFS